MDDEYTTGNLADVETGVANAGTREEDVAIGTNPVTSGEMTRIVKGIINNIGTIFLNPRCLLLPILLIVRFTVSGIFLVGLDDVLTSWQGMK
jgi:hypothetical protein